MNRLNNCALSRIICANQNIYTIDIKFHAFNAFEALNHYIVQFYFEKLLSFIALSVFRDLIATACYMPTTKIPQVDLYTTAGWSSAFGELRE
jgi:hypothetical protein